jgi:hypothetical protein
VVGVPPKIRTKDQVNFGRPVRNVKGTFAFFCCQTKECRSQSASAAKQRVAERSRSIDFMFGS